MSAIQDKTRGTWIAQFYYTNEDGIRKRKRKRGFECESDALIFERSFLLENDDDRTKLNVQKEETMTFDEFMQIYLEDVKYRVKKSTYESKKYLIEKKAIPFFHNMPVDQIKARDIREWQNELLTMTNEKGEPYAPTYLKSIYNHVNAAFNFGVRFYDLKENPCQKAGGIGSTKAKARTIWTLDNFYKFYDVIKQAHPVHAMAIEVMYFTGMRIGELLALSPNDLDVNNNTITISKTYQRKNGEDFTTYPKTRKSLRTISVPESLMEKLVLYIQANLEKIMPTNRLFWFTSGALNASLKKYAKKAKVPQIRLHDLRHSHVSLLIHLGFNANIIADRLGHEKIETTLGIYTHLFPKSREEVSTRLEQFVDPYENRLEIIRTNGQQLKNKPSF